MNRSHGTPGAVPTELEEPPRESAPPAEPPDVDRQIVARFLQGEESAFDELVRRHRKEIYRLAWRITGSHAEADDLAQETFCRAYQALGEFRGECSLRTWLVRIVTNLSVNVLQSARVARRVDAELDALADSGSPDRLLQAERDRQLRRAMEALPPRQKTTLILRVFEELPYKEIARVMGCTVGTAKANFFHAVGCLRRVMQETRS